MSRYGGLLGWLAESYDIQQELGCSAEEARELQKKREAERRREIELAERENNVIPFRPRDAAAS